MAWNKGVHLEFAFESGTLASIVPTLTLSETHPEEMPELDR
jgi:hypothetical protein